MNVTVLQVHQVNSLQATVAHSPDLQPWQETFKAFWRIRGLNFPVITFIIAPSYQ